MDTKNHPKKSLGQHFLHDQTVISRIISALPAGKRVLEIGPGRGALTQHLIPHCSELMLIEKDNDLAMYWHQYAQQHIKNTNKKLIVKHADVLKVLSSCVEQFKPQWIIGNLPYNISGPLTAALADCVSEGMLLMYQYEVAQRICADAGNKTYGRLSVLVRHRYTPKLFLRVAAGAFSPPPKVKSAVIQLIPHNQVIECDYMALQKYVKIGFSKRRKTLANCFRGILTIDDWQALDIDSSLRAERITAKQWQYITNYIVSRD
ncbi:MAG: 16S rRNA (adenine(1518)-N(6)/adenine(1519)-N(6))-dimethyltransferase RsmA [Mariprofundales bacterium]